MDSPALPGLWKSRCRHGTDVKITGHGENIMYLQPILHIASGGIIKQFVAVCVGLLRRACGQRPQLNLRRRPETEMLLFTSRRTENGEQNYKFINVAKSNLWSIEVSYRMSQQTMENMPKCGKQLRPSNSKFAKTHRFSVADPQIQIRFPLLPVSPPKIYS